MSELNINPILISSSHLISRLIYSLLKIKLILLHLMVCIMHLGILIVMLLTKQLTALLHLILRLNIVALKMLVGDLTPLSITDVDQSLLPFRKSLYLKNILLVPDIKNNLIRIFQFTLYNEVTIAFDSSHCCIKDKSTKEALIIIKFTNGLSQLDLPYSSTPVSNRASSSFSMVSRNHSSISINTTNVFTSVCNSAFHLASLWHNRLGHPKSHLLSLLPSLTVTGNQPWTKSSLPFFIMITGSWYPLLLIFL